MAGQSTLGFLEQTAGSLGAASLVAAPDEVYAGTISGNVVRTSNAISFSAAGISGSYALASGTSTFVALANTNSALNTLAVGYYSTDGGSTWSGVTGLSGAWTSMAYSPTLNRFVSVRLNSQVPKANYVCYNEGGRVSWTSATGATGVGTGTFFDVGWGGGKFVAVGDKDLTRTIYSTTGTGTWIAGSLIPVGYADTSWLGLAYSESLSTWVAVGQTASDRVVMTSTDGINWTGRTGPTGPFYQCVAWSPVLGTFLASGAGVSNKYMTSTNGTNWSAKTMSFDTDPGGFIDLHWSSDFGRFFGSNSAGIWTSADGTNWKNVSTDYVQNFASLPYDVDASAFIAASGITGTYPAAINALVLDLKRAGLWSVLTAIYPFAGESASTQKWNLRYPIDANDYLRLTFNGGWSHGATGALANGTNAYANTHLGTQSCAVTNFHMSVYQRLDYTPASAAIDMGSYDESLNYGTLIATQIAINNARARCWRTAMDYVTTDERGNWLVTSNATNGIFYLNGNQIVSRAASGSLPNNPTITIGALNRVTGGVSYYAPGGYTFATIGQTLDEQQIKNLNNAIQKYVTAIGRNV